MAYLISAIAIGGGRFFYGKNAFLTGFGLGFLAFGLKKLMLPFFIGAQIVKSVLIAMFLPSILGGIGKLVGKGVTSFASASNGFGHPNQANQAGQMEDFDFKVSKTKKRQKKVPFDVIVDVKASAAQL